MAEAVGSKAWKSHCPQLVLSRAPTNGHSRKSLSWWDGQPGVSEPWDYAGHVVGQPEIPRGQAQGSRTKWRGQTGTS